MDLLERAKILLKATKDLLEKQENSYYVLNLLTETVFYDGVDCDGTCLKDDIGYWFDELKDASQDKTILLDKVKQAREEIWKNVYEYSGTGDEVLQAYCDGFKASLAILDRLIESEDK